MNLYIINEVLSDYTSGMAVIAAENMEQCRELFIREFGVECSDEYDSAINDNQYNVIEGINHPAGMVSYVYGGG